MLERTQELIMQSWKMVEPCVVSVVCITYNHEQYIREAIESFLMQETSFPFEIIIHDDASTDNTPDIIKEYHSRYPDIIRPIFQKENQFSQGGFKPSFYAVAHSDSKYIALCEGDDYWVSKNKLQIQIEAMEIHPELDFSFHSAYRLNDVIRDDKPSWDYGDNQLLYPDSILSCVGSFAPTASYVVRREVMGNMPDWFFNKAPVGDFFLEMYGAKRGGCLYINLPMSIYRTGVPSSWTAKMTNYKARIKSAKMTLESLQLMKKDFSRHHASFKRKESVLFLRIAICNLHLKNDADFSKNIKKSVDLFSFFSLKQRVVYWFNRAPFILRLLIKVQQG